MGDPAMQWRQREPWSFRLSYRDVMSRLDDWVCVSTLESCGRQACGVCVPCAEAATCGGRLWLERPILVPFSMAAGSFPDRLWVKYKA